MNSIQQKLLDIARLENIENIRRVDLVNMIGCNYPSQITHHLRQLIKHGELVRKNGRLMPTLNTDSSLLRIPVLGEADCGEATKFADGQIIDYLAVSPSLLTIKNTNNIFALVARGDSMNHASVSGKTINDGDYIIVRKIDAYEPQNNDIVVSNIGGLANVKIFKRDDGRIVLHSNSYRQQDFAPIIISELDDFRVEGKVIDVVEGVNL